MNVQQLMDFLQLCPKDWEVLITSEDIGAEFPVDTVLQFSQDKTVWVVFKDQPIDEEGYESEDEEDTSELDEHAGERLIAIEFEEGCHHDSVPA